MCSTPLPGLKVCTTCRDRVSITCTVSFSGCAKFTQTWRPPVCATTNTGWPCTAMRPTSFQSVAVHHQHLVLADGRQEHMPARHGPALEVRHLVDRQFLLAAAVIVQNAPHTLLWLPQVQQCEAILAEQAGNVVAAVRCNQGIVGKSADIAETSAPRCCRGRSVDTAYLAGIIERVHEALPGRIHQPDDLSTVCRLVSSRRQVSHQCK